jgi:hypothetical protein
MSKPAPLQEPDALPRGPILLVAAAAVFIGAAATIAGGAMALHSRPPVRPPPPPVVEQTLIDGPARGIELQRAHRAELDRYGWVDKDAGIARIPIDRAIDIVVEDAE